MDRISRKFEDYGGLFKNKKAQSKRAPQLLGEIALSQDCVRHLVEAVKNGSTAKLNLAAWKNVAAKTGENYFTLKATPPAKHIPGAALEDDPFDV